MATPRTPEIEEKIREQRREDWKKILGLELGIVLEIQKSRFLVEEGDDTRSLLTTEQEGQFTDIKKKIDYDKTWNQNLEIIRRAVAPFEIGHTLPTFEEELARSGFKLWLPHQFGGTYVDNKGEEEVRAAPTDGTPYQLVNNHDIHEEFLLDDDGRRKIVYSPDEIKEVGYILQPNDEKIGATYPDGRQRVRTRTGYWVRVFKYQVGTGFEVNSWDTYEQWRELTDPEEPPIVFLPPPHKVGNNEVWTYDQFKVYVLHTYPRDYLEVKRTGTKIYKTKVVAPDYQVNLEDFEREEKILEDIVLPDGNKILQYAEIVEAVEETTRLTYLASFVEKFLKEEALSPGKQHLIRLLKAMEYDFLRNEPVFWERIRKHVKIPVPPAIPTALLHPDIQEMVNDLKGYITFLYSSWPDPYDLPGFYAAQAAILKEYEFLLREVYFRFLKAPNFFRLNGQMVTRIIDNSHYGESYRRSREEDRNRQFEVVDEHSSAENPLKSSINENLREYAAYKAMIVQTQSTNLTKETINQAKTSEGGRGGKEGSRGVDKYIYKDVDPMDTKKLEWVDKVLQYFLVYKKVRQELDKFFYYSFEIERNLGYEDEDEEV